MQSSASAPLCPFFKIKKAPKKKLQQHKHNMSLFYPYSHRHHQCRGPLISQSPQPRGSYIGPSNFSEVESTFNKISRWADQTYQQLLSGSEGRSLSGPRFSVEDTGDAYVLEGDLQGMHKDDVTIHLVNSTTLTVRGHTETVRHDGKDKTQETIEPVQIPSSNTEAQSDNSIQSPSPEAIQETTPASSSPSPTSSSLTLKPSSRTTHRHTTQFKRTFTLPDGVDATTLSVTFKDGKLGIHAPKPGKAKFTDTSDTTATSPATTGTVVDDAPHQDTEIDVDTTNPQPEEEDEEEEEGDGGMVVVSKGEVVGIDGATGTGTGATSDVPGSTGAAVANQDPKQNGPVETQEESKKTKGKGKKVQIEVVDDDDE